MSQLCNSSQSVEHKHFHFKSVLVAKSETTHNFRNDIMYI